uniref:glycoside hydrolase family 9 protein n=1 Tax=Cellvibrio fontiphilus TaxID=1815559 RepID=UPI002B4BCD18|nr:glycoside hydrolase family 9 protein [Cellvibrio fontiphilus]
MKNTLKNNGQAFTRELKTQRTRLFQVVGAGLLSLAAIHAQAQTGNPRVNQLGYLPTGAKTATYKTNQTAAQTWQLRQNGTLVASGQTLPTGTDAASGDNLHQIDLSNVTATGSGFTLTVGSDSSYNFAISTTALKPALYDALKYFYHNRSGIAIETQYTGDGNGSFASNSKWSRPAGHLNIGANKGDINVPCWSGTCNYSLNVSKGWYDAGDHGKYVVNGGISVWTLLNLYERDLYLSRNGSLVGDGKLNIPESANGVADVLDEARWQMEFMMAMQVPVGQAKAGMAHHKMHDVGWTGFPLAPHEDPQQRALVPPSTAATLNLAATAAQCARIWKDIDSGFASSCLTAATRAWDAAQANPNDIYSGNYDNGGGGYGDANVADEFYWAAAELYITTGDSKYLSRINNYLITRNDFGWPDTELPGLISLAMVPTSHTTSLRASARQKITSIANGILATQNASGYPAPLSTLEYYWGSNGAVANKLILLGLAYDFTGNDNYAKGVGKGLNYFFGQNTLSTSFVTGAGTKTATQPHHRFWSNAINANYPAPPPGALSGGPNAGLEDSTSATLLGSCKSRPATCWADNIHAYAVNEITINWNAPLAWNLAFYNDYAQGNGGGQSSSSLASSSSLPASSSSLATTSSSSSRAPSSSSVASSSIAPSSSSVASSISGAQQCNWYGTLYPLCATTTSGWGYENNRSCISASTCSAQPAPFGIVGGGTSSTPASSTPASSRPASSTPSSVAPSSVASSRASSTPPASSSSSVAGGGNCQYLISNEWNNGFTASLRITNTGNSPINGWTVNWSYSDGTRITNSWNGVFSGNNPYSVSNLGWNGTIQPGQSVEVGFQGTKGTSGSAQIPRVTGSVCN